MSPYEIVSKYGSVEHYNEEAGLVWLNRLKEHFSDVVWINPIKPQHWKYTDSIQIIREWSGNKMFPLSIQGITKAMKCLKNNKLTYEID